LKLEDIQVKFRVETLIPEPKSLILNESVQQISREKERNDPSTNEKGIDKEHEVELNSLIKGSFKKNVEMILRLVVKYHNQNEPMLMRIREKLATDKP
jgi:hypothetical protein